MLDELQEVKTAQSNQMRPHILRVMRDAMDALQQLAGNHHTLAQIESAARIMSAALMGRQRIFSCGNGGSMSDAIHFAEELSGRFREDRRALAAVAISDPGYLSCVANDYGFDQVFSRYLEAHGAPGDILLAISTSGQSTNVCRAAAVADGLGMTVISLTGREGSPLGLFAELDICTPGGAYADRVQELHIKVIHTLIELIERTLFSHLYSEVSQP